MRRYLSWFTGGDLYAGRGVLAALGRRCLPSFSIVSPDAAGVVFLVEASIIALCAASIFTKIGQQFFRHGVCDTGQFKVINIFERGPNSWTGKSLGLCRRA